MLLYIYNESGQARIIKGSRPGPTKMGVLWL